MLYSMDGSRASVHFESAQTLDELSMRDLLMTHFKFTDKELEDGYD